ncbi:MAG TPA: hypothetical protein VKG26_15960 [Bacteroidia bacterium]|nr:hypothetical protein [Bacteroidia bacterium]
MSQTIIRYLLFLIAYIPIYIIAALKTFNATVIHDCGQSFSYRAMALNNLIPIFLIVLSIILIIYFKIYSWLALNPKGNPIFTIKSIKPQHKEYVTYLGTYILPFAALETKTHFDMIAVAFMFLTIGFIFSKTNLIYTNPTLAFFGYDIFEITDENGKTIDCISKDDFKIEDRPRGLKLGENTFIISKWKRDN